MARLRTLLQMRESAREQADETGSQFVSDAVANTWINSSIARLQSLLVKADATRYLRETTIATTSGTVAYSLPADFASAVACSIVSGQQRIRLQPLNWNEEIGPGSPSPAIELDGYRPRYRIIGSLGTAAGGGAGEQVLFDPDPGANSYVLRYIPALTPLTLDAHTLDSVYGFDDWIVYDVAMRMATKAENLQLASFLKSCRDDAQQMILDMAEQRDVGDAPQVADVRSGRRWDY